MTPRGGWCGLLLLAQVACASANWAQPVGDFKKSVDESVAVIAGYYDNLNAFERRVYLADALADPAKRIGTTEADGKPTPLSGQVFSARGIKARTDALALVSLYARRLADLAGSDAPAEFRTNVGVLGDNLTKLDDTFRQLSSGGAEPADSRAGAYVGPIAQLVGLVGQIYLEHRRDAALEKAIGEGAPVVDKILKSLEDDLVAVVDPLQRTGNKQMLAQLVVDYNNGRATASESQRRAQLAAIEKAAEAADTALTFNPSSVLSGLREAHAALIAYAKSPRKPTDLASLSDALSIFADRVDVAAAAVRGLRSAR